MGYIDAMLRIATALTARSDQLLADHDLPDWHKKQIRRFRKYMLDVSNLLLDSSWDLSRTNGTVLADYSHELRTPLCAIGYLDLLLQDARSQDGPTMNPGQRENVAEMLGMGRQLLSMVNDLLENSKMLAGKLEIYPEVFDLHFIFDEMAENFPTQPGQETMPIKLPQQPIWVKADRMQTKSVIYKMCFEAFGRNTVRRCELNPATADLDFTEIAFDFPTLRYSDNGLSQLLDQQHALETESLDLVLARSLTELQGGQFSAVIGSESGIKFFVRLPPGDFLQR